MVSFHVILLCGGQGSRYAGSVGAQPPYPKHLERIGNTSVLHRTIESMLHNFGSFGITGITTILNPALQEHYVGHLREIQAQFPDIPLSYALSHGHEERKVCTSAASDIHDGVWNLDGDQVDFGDPLVLLTYGDQIVYIENTDGLKREVESYEESLARGDEVKITVGGWPCTATLFALGKLDSLVDQKMFYMDTTHVMPVEPYGLKGWNINTREDLLEAIRGLSILMLEKEGSLFNNKEY